MIRPRCKRCNGPLDWWQCPETKLWYWFCNNPGPIYDDKEFWQHWEELPGDAIVQLTKSRPCMER